MKNWEVLAEEINAWAFKNYGVHSTPWQLLLGVVEEVGEFYEARDRNDRSGMVDSFGDQAIYALNLCKTVGIPGFPDDNSPTGWYRRVTTEDLLKSVGLGSRGILKNSQGIRGMGESQMREHITKFIRMWRMWVTNQLEMYALQPLLDITNVVWGKVSERDWQAHPLTGGTEVRPPSVSCHGGLHCTNWPDCESCGPPRI